MKIVNVILDEGVESILIWQVVKSWDAWSVHSSNSHIQLDSLAALYVCTVDITIKLP